MSRICIDSGFLIALSDHTDAHHLEAADRFERHLRRSRNELLVPWPILYETVSTKLVRDRRKLDRFRSVWLTLEKRRYLELLDDRPMLSGALAECLNELDRSVEHYRSLSLTDRVIRAMLADRALRIDALITFNVRDFVDVCTRHGRELL